MRNWNPWPREEGEEEILRPDFDLGTMASLFPVIAMHRKPYGVEADPFLLRDHVLSFSFIRSKLSWHNLHIAEMKLGVLRNKEISNETMVQIPLADYDLYLRKPVANLPDTVYTAPNVKFELTKYYVPLPIDVNNLFHNHMNFNR